MLNILKPAGNPITGIIQRKKTVCTYVFVFFLCIVPWINFLYVVFVQIYTVQKYIKQCEIITVNAFDKFTLKTTNNLCIYFHDNWAKIPKLDKHKT